MSEAERENLEVDLLLEALARHRGYDFRSYARASLERRLRAHLRRIGRAHLSELIPLCLHDEQAASDLVQDISVSVTELFRDPHVHRSLRERVLPSLATYPFIRIWHAGCATGEEVYSMAILLHEAGLLKRSTIFGTDFNDDSLAKAERAIYRGDAMQEATRNYQESGGTASFAEYYHGGYDSATLRPFLKKAVTFANHNLVTDDVFGEMHLVVCRNVLIYFDRSLQDRALELFTRSLIRGGFLCLGTRETLRFSSVADDYETVDAEARIFKKKVER